MPFRLINSFQSLKKLEEESMWGKKSNISDQGRVKLLFLLFCVSPYRQKVKNEWQLPADWQPRDSHYTSQKIMAEEIFSSHRIESVFLFYLSFINKPTYLSPNSTFGQSLLVLILPEKKGQISGIWSHCICLSQGQHSNSLPPTPITAVSKCNLE